MFNLKKSLLLLNFFLAAFLFTVLQSTYASVTSNTTQPSNGAGSSTTTQQRTKTRTQPPPFDYAIGDLPPNWSRLVKNQTLNSFTGEWKSLVGRTGPLRPLLEKLHTLPISQFTENISGRFKINATENPVRIAFTSGVPNVPEIRHALDLTKEEQTVSAGTLPTPYKIRSIFHNGKIITKATSDRLGTLYIVSAVFDSDPEDLTDSGPLLLTRITYAKKTILPLPLLQPRSTDIWMELVDSEEDSEE